MMHTVVAARARGVLVMTAALALVAGLVGLDWQRPRPVRLRIGGSPCPSAVARRYSCAISTSPSIKAPRPQEPFAARSTTARGFVSDRPGVLRPGPHPRTSPG